MALERSLPQAVQDEIIKQGTRPFYLVRLLFANAELLISSGPTTTYLDQIYVEGAIRVGSFSWDADGVQRGQIALLNENLGASALILGNTVADTPVWIYESYVTTTGNTTPILMVKGVLDHASLNPTEAVLDVVSSSGRNDLVPSRFHSQTNGFNWLPKAGSTVTWNNERYELIGN